MANSAPTLQVSEVKILSELYGDDWKTDGDQTRRFATNLGHAFKSVATDLKQIATDATGIAERINAYAEDEEISASDLGISMLQLRGLRESVSGVVNEYKSHAPKIGKTVVRKGSVDASTVSWLAQ